VGEQSGQTLTVLRDYDAWASLQMRLPRTSFAESLPKNSRFGMSLSFYRANGEWRMANGEWRMRAVIPATVPEISLARDNVFHRLGPRLA
jgi:hypothetical protein